MSVAALASAASLPLRTVAGYESGRVRPGPEVLDRVLRAARTRPSIPLSVHADEILAEAVRHRLVDVRVFGSAVRGQDTADSDIDLLVGLAPGASLFDLGGFAHVVEELTGFDVDLLTDDVADDPHFAHVLAEAVPL